MLPGNGLEIPKRKIYLHKIYLKLARITKPQIFFSSSDIKLIYSTILECKGLLRSRDAVLFFCLRVQFSRRESAQVDSKSSHFFSRRVQNIGEVLARRAQHEKTFKIHMSMS